MSCTFPVYFLVICIHGRPSKSFAQSSSPRHIHSPVLSQPSIDLSATITTEYEMLCNINICPIENTTSVIYGFCNHHDTISDKMVFRTNCFYCLYIAIILLVIFIIFQFIHSKQYKITDTTPDNIDNKHVTPLSIDTNISNINTTSYVACMSPSTSPFSSNTTFVTSPSSVSSTATTPLSVSPSTASISSSCWDDYEESKDFHCKDEIEEIKEMEELYYNYKTMKWNVYNEEMEEENANNGCDKQKKMDWNKEENTHKIGELLRALLSGVGREGIHENDFYNLFSSPSPVKIVYELRFGGFSNFSVVKLDRFGRRSFHLKMC